jgi:hypothetical protein
VARLLRHGTCCAVAVHCRPSDQKLALGDRALVAFRKFNVIMTVVLAALVGIFLELVSSVEP